jgi:hypothetical protein
VHRFTHRWAATASQLLRSGDAKALDAYEVPLAPWPPPLRREKVCYDSSGVRPPVALARRPTSLARRPDRCRAAPPERLCERPAVLISVIVLGFVASLDPLRPMVFLLVLRAQFVNTMAFLAGWTLALSVLFGIVFLTFAGDTSTVRGPGNGPRRPLSNSPSVAR